MGGQDAPEEGHPLEEDVSHVEGGEGPLVPVFPGGIRLEVGFHSGYAGIADVWRGFI